MQYLLDKQLLLTGEKPTPGHWYITTNKLLLQVKKVVCIHTWDGLGCTLADIKYIPIPQRAHLGSLALIYYSGSFRSVISLPSPVHFSAFLQRWEKRAPTRFGPPAQHTDSRSRARDERVSHQPHPLPKSLTAPPTAAVSGHVPWHGDRAGYLRDVNPRHRCS